ncbi:hypothetical protein [Paenibacillus bouchesdurhonensis]|uniref:hypothetical protein n=1 Tax=Paenibacillus bouchesdurhonensis TaxID=1870990 RepID=UPI001F29C385|nr:hypothetical protein [Paenibacillus bouchesdurhonensis]
MVKKIVAALALVIVVLWLVGRYTSNIEKKEMVETATILSQEYIKKYYKSEYILKDYDIIHPSISSTIFMYGYIEGHEDETITVVYNYRKKEVDYAKGPSWFIESRNPKYPSLSGQDTQ